MTPNTEQYIQAIKEEVQKLENGKFTGNVEFKINWKDGYIKNVNCALNKCIILPRK